MIKKPELLSDEEQTKFYNKYWSVDEMNPWDIEGLLKAQRDKDYKEVLERLNGILLKLKPSRLKVFIQS